MSFEVQKLYILMKSNLFFPLVVSALCVTSNKLSLNPRSQRFVPMLSSKYFIILALIIRSMVHSQLIFVYGVRQGSKFILLLFDLF